MDDPLVPLDEFAAYLQRDLDLATAVVALAGASGVARSWCAWPISNVVEVMTLDGSDSRLLTLPTLVLNDVLSVTIDGVVVDPDTYRWSRRGQLLRSDGNLWPKAFDNIGAHVDHGYVEVPPEVRIVVCSLAARYYTNPEGLRSKTLGAASKTYVLETMRGDLTVMEMALLDRHRLI